MRNLLLLISGIFICNIVNSQNWELYKEKDGVKIYYAYQDCHIEKDDFHRQYVLLKFENTTNKFLQVKWRVRTWYDGKCHGCNTNSPEFERLLSLEPKQTKVGDCEFNSSKLLRIFSKFLNYQDKSSELEKFEIYDISVYEIKRENSNL